MLQEFLGARGKIAPQEALERAASNVNAAIARDADKSVSHKGF
jgi:hypothetical protein